MSQELPPHYTNLALNHIYLIRIKSDTRIYIFLSPTKTSLCTIKGLTPGKEVANG